MTSETLLKNITAQVEAFKAAATISPADEAEIADLRTQHDAIKHEGARTAITREIERKTGLAKMAAERRADEAVRELYDNADLKRLFGLRVRSAETAAQAAA